MNRREAIQKATLVLGYAVTGPALAGVLSGCKAQPGLTYTPEFFTEEQALLIDGLAEVIIPKTSTPGAKDAGVPGFIDRILNAVYSATAKDRFVKGLTEFDDDARKTYGKNFVSCEPEEQIAHVKRHLENALSGATVDTAIGWWRAADGAGKPFILEMKELTLLGFFTSEPGATQVLQYSPVPGPFRGCVPLAEVGKAWAT